MKWMVAEGSDASSEGAVCRLTRWEWSRAVNLSRAQSTNRTANRARQHSTAQRKQSVLVVWIAGAWQRVRCGGPGFSAGTTHITNIRPWAACYSGHTTGGLEGGPLARIATRRI
jgi:hypothetical protein